MGENKRWKREAKRMIGIADIFGTRDCFLCVLSTYQNKSNKYCHGACRGQIRHLEKMIKQENLSKNNPPQFKNITTLS